MEKYSRIKIDHLSIFLKKEQKKIVSDLTFQIKKDHVTCLLGQSGSGKSLTVLAILGLLPSSLQASGSVTLGEIDMLHLQEQNRSFIRGKEIALIMQNPMSAFNPIVTIGKQVIETLRIHLDLSNYEAEQLCKLCLKKVSLIETERVMSLYPFQLSGGMLQRVMIALIFALKPSFLIADEPTTALDKVTQSSILQELLQLQSDTNMGMLLITHDLAVMSQIADDVLVLHEGTIVEKQPVNRLFSQPKHSYTKQLLRANLRLQGV
ncbi:ABC transporter ATP-binding protein [Priestia megaterium]|nr:ABC transporter ATP-binding protein [Priestia megaterium]